MVVHMIELKAILLLCSLEKSGSISGAARAMNMPRATAWRHIQRLEESIGCRLLERSQSHNRLTAAGRVVVSRGRSLVKDVDDMREAALSESRGSQGVIRIGGPSGNQAKFVAMGLSFFREIYPGTRFEVFESAAPLHPLRDDFDLVISFHRPTDPSLYVKQSGVIQWRCVASQAYLDEAGTPETVEDLLKHPVFVCYAPPRLPSQVTLVSGGSFDVLPLLSTTNPEAVTRATEEGFGIGYMPWAPDQGDGALKLVLDGVIGDAVPVYIIAGQRSVDSERVRLILDILTRLHAFG